MEAYFKQHSSITIPERAAIQHLRALAILCILCCHLLEAYGNLWSATFYVGVPLFFILSGFLYGRKNIDNWVTWSVLRVKKIYLPYFLFIVVALALWGIFFPHQISLFQSIAYLCNLQGFVGCSPGLNHLWFVTAIVACYVCLPFLQYLKRWNGCCLLLSWALFLLDVFLFQARFYWLPLYMIAYFMASATRRQLLFSLLFVLSGFVFQILTWKTILVFDIATQYHVTRSLLALLLTLAFLFLFRKCAIVSVSPLIAMVSKFSYSFYLVHNILMIGPFSLATFTNSRVWNIVLMVVVSILLTGLLHLLARGLDKKLFPSSAIA